MGKKNGELKKISEANLEINELHKFIEIQLLGQCIPAILPDWQSTRKVAHNGSLVVCLNLIGPRPDIKISFRDHNAFLVNKEFLG